MIQSPMPVAARLAVPDNREATKQGCRNRRICWGAGWSISWACGQIREFEQALSIMDSQPGHQGMFPKIQGGDAPALYPGGGGGLGLDEV